MDSNEPECNADGKLSETTTQAEFWPDTGPESSAGETCGNLLPTPTGNQYECDPKKLLERRERCKATHQNGNGFGLTTAGAVSLGLTSSVAASPASLFRWREVAKGMVMSAGYGTSSPSVFASFSHDGCLLKTSQGCSQLLLDGSFEEYSGTFPKWGSMRNGELCRQRPLVRRISGKECSLLPTPEAKNHTGYQVANGKKYPRLGEVAKLLPTPRASENENRQTKPTPSQLAGTHGKCLSAEIGGLLNPQFVEAIMGFPPGWTDLDALETP